MKPIFRSLPVIASLLAVTASFATAGTAFAGNLQNGDARQLAQILENSGIKPLNTQFFQFVSAYSILCNVTGNVTGQEQSCVASMTQMDPAVTRKDVSASDAKALVELLGKAGFKPATSGLADGTAGQSFVGATTVNCEINLAGPDFYAECDFQ